MPRLHLDLDHTAEAAPRARRGVVAFLQEQWPRWCAGTTGTELVDDVAIVVSELVGNAVRHGSAPVSFDVVALDGDGTHTVRLECHDAGPWDGTPSRPHGGRGFVIVRGLASEVAIDTDPAHTCVSVVFRR